MNTINERECDCVSCPDCLGSGTVSVIDPLNMPFDDIESCGSCRGSGVSEECANCECQREEREREWNYQ